MLACWKQDLTISPLLQILCSTKCRPYRAWAGLRCHWYVELRKASSIFHYVADIVVVLLQAMKADPPLDAKCRDKFLVQSAPITPDKEFAPIASVVSYRLPNMIYLWEHRLTLLHL
jgi:hypothetical protein